VTNTLDVPRARLHFTFAIVDGWPPVAGETVWATELDLDRFIVDNIPFFAIGIALNDVVEAKADDQGGLEFVRKISSGGHSTIRVIAKESLHSKLKAQLRELGCGMESGVFPTHFAVDVPPETDLVAVLSLCKRWLANGIAEYETGCLQS
jgi:hypothetical protein